MSNPAVTKLIMDSIGGLKFYMDDNIGESIHIHLDEFRLDLTCDEFNNLTVELKQAINGLVNVDGFDVGSIDPVFLALFLASDLPHLKKIRFDMANLKDLNVSYRTKYGFKKITKLEKSRAFKALAGDGSENNDRRASHHIGQSSEERLNSIFNSIKDNGYPYNNNYIILYEDQFLIRDGQHRASCLYFLNGPIDIPVMRLYFDNNDISYYDLSYYAQIKHKMMTLLRMRKKDLVKDTIKRLKKATVLLRNHFVLLLGRRKIREVKTVYYYDYD